ncbi:MAG: ABC transporter permease [Candidatus Cyclobacteriaceae bacterium M3_2C_046]
MLKNYFYTAIRNFWYQKGYSFINILGLSVGLATSLLIFLAINHELSTDRFHQDIDQVYRVMENQYYSRENIFTTPATPGPLADYLKKEMPEVELASRMSWYLEQVFFYDQKSFKETGFYVDPDFLQMFSYPFVEGDQQNALSDFSSVVISEQLAHKLFSGESALNKVVAINDNDYKITGVFENVPQNASLQFDFLLNIERYIGQNSWTQTWGNNGLLTFIKISEQADPIVLEDKIRKVVKENNDQSVVELFIQPYGDMYLYSDFDQGKVSGGKIEYVRIFIFVAIFILVIAIINFMNLSTARAAKRAKEVGIRKVVGATNYSLKAQFLGESILLTFFSLMFAVGLVEAILPVYNQVIGKTLIMDYGSPIFLLKLAGIALATGLLAGSYPAFYLSSFESAKILKGSFKSGKAALAFRKGLVIFQFSLSILLIISTMIIYNQVNFIKNTDIGLDRENVVWINIEGDLRKNFKPFKNDLEQFNFIQQVSSSNFNPLNIGNSSSGVNWPGKVPDENILFSFINVDYDFIETLGMRMDQGRSFSPQFASDSVGIIINQKAADVMGLENPVNQIIQVSGFDATILGVVEDFNFHSMRAVMEPLIMVLRPQERNVAFIKTHEKNPAESLAAIEQVYKKYNGNFPFAYHFLDQTFDEMYKSEIMIGRLASMFAVIAIFISCLGLFGLASYSAEQRTREIGIRKVLGASASNLVIMVSGQFTILVAIAFALTAPLAYWLMNDWLNNFAYRINLTLPVFMLSGLAALLIAWITVSYQSIKAAFINPVNSLRSE